MLNERVTRAGTNAKKAKTDAAAARTEATAAKADAAAARTEATAAKADAAAARTEVTAAKADAAAAKKQVEALGEQFKEYVDDDAAIAPICEAVGFFYDVVLDKVNEDLAEDDKVPLFRDLTWQQKEKGALDLGLTKQEWTSIRKYKDDRNDKHHHIEHQNGSRGLTEAQAGMVTKAVDGMFVPPKAFGLQTGLAKIIPLVTFA